MVRKKGRKGRTNSTRRGKEFIEDRREVIWDAGDVKEEEVLGYD